MPKSDWDMPTDSDPIRDIQNGIRHLEQIDGRQPCAPITRDTLCDIFGVPIPTLSAGERVVIKGRTFEVMWAHNGAALVEAVDLEIKCGVDYPAYIMDMK